MAEIKLERRSSGAKWLWILLFLLLLALLAWWLWPDAEPVDEIEDTTVGVVEPAPVVTPEPLDVEPAVGTEGIPVAEIAANPLDWVGRTVSGQVEVGEVPTDRGFWVEGGGERVFALIVDEPLEEPVDINQGQTLDISTATVRSADDREGLAGDPLDADTEAILTEQEVFLLVPESSLARYPG